MSDRKISYKLPPTTIRDKLVSQEARRNKALEEQKRRRAHKIDSARQLDLFAGLTLGTSDDEESPIQESTIEEEESEETRLAPASVAQYAAMLQPGFDNLPPNTIHTNDPSISNTDSAIQVEYSTEPTVGKKKRSGGGSASKQKRRAKKASKWADRCMYAELLEMSADDPWNYEQGKSHDGLPSDLENGWVAVAPVPVGKRCLAVTQQSAGVAGVVPNTTLRSRLLGKTLLVRFPSALPPLTVLDCILDDQWRENGILHVLDVVKWKGQDVADCEAGFRFWWRDTRLAELAQTPPPASINFLATSTSPYPKYHFPYPTSFIPVPYHASTTLSKLDNEIIPAARTWREVNVPVPMPMGSGMDIEPSVSSPRPQIQLQPQIALTSTQTHVQPDGMLLYVAEASYEPGTSPLSSWIPIRGYDMDKGEVAGDKNGPEAQSVTISSQGPLDLFQRLVRRRLAKQLSGVSTTVNPDILLSTGAHLGPELYTQGAGSPGSTGNSNVVDVDMDV